MTDRATQLSLDYLRILEERLPFEWDQHTRTIIAPETNIFTLQRVKNEITDLFAGATLDKAIGDAREFGKNRVQTVGFGFAEDFDKFVKLGFLCGRRLVLWDFIWSRLLKGELDDSAPMLAIVNQTAFNMLLLKPIVQAGGLTILPHPTEWSEKTRYELSRFDVTKLSTQSMGLIAVMSVLEEIPMHPYTLFPGPSLGWPGHPEQLASFEYFSDEQYAFHRALDDVFEDTRFTYFKDMSAADFYAICARHTDFYDELRRTFGPLPGALSPQQVTEHAHSARNAVARAVANRNKLLVAEAATRQGSNLAFVAAFGTLLNATFTGNSKAGVALAGLGVSSALLRALASWLKRDKQSVVVQAFVEMRGLVHPRSTGGQPTPEGE